jgi:hypothetical protein
MSHPVDLLAPYVDGTLEPSEREVLDAHLRSCARCRNEVAAANAARHALREMPTPQAPDLEAGFTAERVPGLAAPPASPRAPWSKLAPIIAAAAVVALVALVVPRLGGSSDDTGTAADGLAEGGAGGRPALRLQIETIDYDEETLGEVAGAFAARATDPAAGAGGAVAEDAAGQSPPAPGTRYAGQARTDRAVACLERAFPGYPGELVQVKQAGFQGTPAFIGYVLESPDGDAKPETLSLWVADVADCSILSLISARI